MERSGDSISGEAFGSLYVVRKLLMAQRKFKENFNSCLYWEDQENEIWSQRCATDWVKNNDVKLTGTLVTLVIAVDAYILFLNKQEFEKQKSSEYISRISATNLIDSNLFFT